MEPRWNKYWLEESTEIYLGGTNALDLWIDGDTDLRMVNGDGSENWDYFRILHDGQVERVSYDTDISAEEIEEAFIYLSLFVPDWKDRVKQMRSRWDNAAAMG